MEVTGRFGKCVFGDCLELLKDHTEQPDHFLADFRFERGIKSKIYDKKEGAVPYDNDWLNDEDYYDFCREWFNLISKSCNRLVITPGCKNLSWWTNEHPELKTGIWIRRNGQNRGSFSLFTRWEPILFLGKFNRVYDEDVFDVIVDNGFLREDDSIIHHHPKPRELIEKLLLPLQPKSVLDIMVGSGTTCLVCEKYGIKWLGFELMEEYKPDIEKRINDGINSFVPNRQKSKQEKVI